MPDPYHMVYRIASQSLRRASYLNSDRIYTTALMIASMGRIHRDGKATHIDASRKVAFFRIYFRNSRRCLGNAW